MDPSVDYAEYLRQKYQLGEMAQEEGYERPSTADFSEFTKESDRQQQQQQRQPQRPATSLESWGCDGDGSGRSSSLAEPPVAPVASFTERRIKNTAQSLKTAILNEIIENRIYEEKRLKQLFRSYMKLNSGEAFYPTLCSVIEDLRQELDVK
ncbi:hypothetical protein N2152v2_000803 [Parachlorella kessleri]